MARLRNGAVRVLFGAVITSVLGAAPAYAAPSPARAFFMSLAVPGWGQMALGAPRRAAVFVSLEGALVLSAVGFRTMRGIYEDDYRAFAASVAGANVAGKDRTYFSDLAFYDTRIQHNQAALIYDQPEPMLYPIEDDWQWPTTEDRLRYRERFNRAKTMDQRMGYMVFAISLNHLVSAIDAAKQASRRRNESGEGSAEAGLRVTPLPDGGGKVMWVWRF